MTFRRRPDRSSRFLAASGFRAPPSFSFSAPNVHPLVHSFTHLLSLSFSFSLFPVLRLLAYLFPTLKPLEISIAPATGVCRLYDAIFTPLSDRDSLSPTCLAFLSSVSLPFFLLFPFLFPKVNL